MLITKGTYTFDVKYIIFHHYHISSFIYGETFTKDNCESYIFIIFGRFPVSVWKNFLYFNKFETMRPI